MGLDADIIHLPNSDSYHRMSQQGAIDLPEESGKTGLYVTRIAAKYITSKPRTLESCLDKHIATPHAGDEIVLSRLNLGRE